MAARKPSHVYVYYRIDADTLEKRARIHALIDDVQAATGVHGRLLARFDDALTWMEVYEPIADTTIFARELAALVERHQASAIAVEGERHVECFSALLPLPKAGGH